MRVPNQDLQPTKHAPPGHVGGTPSRRLRASGTATTRPRLYCSDTHEGAVRLTPASLDAAELAVTNHPDGREQDQAHRPSVEDCIVARGSEQAWAAHDGQVLSVLQTAGLTSIDDSLDR